MGVGHKLSVLKKKLRQFNKNSRARMKYLKYYRDLPIQPHDILVDSQHGDELKGNLFYILRELTSNPAYAAYTVYVAVKPSKKSYFEMLLQENEIENAVLLPLNTKQYYRVAASAKFLINDTSFLSFFIKKEGQVYLNTWHGTPLKTLGKQVRKEPHTIGNVQRNLQMADYLLFPNDFTFEHIVEDYMLEDICDATVLMGGYPRNTAFFDTAEAETIRLQEELDGKTVYVYMPTWRGVVGRSDQKASTYLQYFLYEIDKRLKSNEILYVNLHPLARKNINFQAFSRVRQIPPQYETYEFLNVADCLVTDYSSVFFDFAITGKKIVLFTYDEKEYLTDRGLYMPLKDLPFPKASNVDELLKELWSPKEYDDAEFVRTYCAYEAADATRLLCERVILDKQGLMEERKISKNGKDNVLIYVGNLAKNGITTSMQNLLTHIDLSQHNYFITFDARKIQENRDILFTLPPKVRYLSCMGEMNMSFWQKTFYILYAKGWAPFWMFWPIVKSAFPYELKRRYGKIPFSTVIQFNGYEHEKILMYAQAECNSVIYVHNDMVNEIETRGIQRKPVLKYAYTHYDKLAVVSEDIMPPTKTFTNGRDDHFFLAKNIIHYRDILKKATKPFVLDSDTVVTPDRQQLQPILENDSKKFITIGRFSPEKGHLRLIDAFNRVWADHPDTYLVILGGHGVLYETTLEHAASLPCHEHVIVIRSMSNPYIVLTRCDYFVLSSLYEGFGIVIAEADILGKPVISTNINGPRGFMQRYGGKLVEDSEEGLYQGMLEELRGHVQPMHVDFEEYNQEAVDQFYRLLE